MKNKFKPYRGTVHGNTPPPLVKRAYQAWADQRKRCNNHKAASYPWYGAKGISVEYDSKEFITWYPFDNIEMQEKRDNCLESLKRTGFEKRVKKSKPIAAYNRHTGELIKIFASRKEAEKETGVSASNIWGICKGFTRGTRGDLTFKFYGENLAKSKT